MTNIGMKSFSETGIESNLVHSPFYPADVRQGDPITASLRVIPGEKSTTMAVWRLSPFGIELVADPNVSIPSGSEIDLTLTLGRQQSRFTGLVVTSRHRSKGRELIGIRWYQTPDAHESGAEERRSTSRWLCGSEFLPTGVAPNPARFNDFIHFRVRDLSSTGMQLVTSLRNKFIVPGMQILINLFFVPTNFSEKTTHAENRPLLSITDSLQYDFHTRREKVFFDRAVNH